MLLQFGSRSLPAWSLVVLLVTLIALPLVLAVSVVPGYDCEAGHIRESHRFMVGEDVYVNFQFSGPGEYWAIVKMPDGSERTAWKYLSGIPPGILYVEKPAGLPVGKRTVELWRGHPWGAGERPTLLAYCTYDVSSSSEQTQPPKSQQSPSGGQSIPGFGPECIIVGIALGMLVLAFTRRSQQGLLCV
jgi:hypothetical protein